MSTACLIAIHLGDEQYRSIYCHFDGYDYDQGVGPTLRSHFNNEDNARSLIELGDLSYIKGNEVCAYHRDRGDDWDKTLPVISNSKNDLLKRAQDNWASCLYVFEDGSWQSLTI
jgi:hypothetical protein